MKIKLILDDRGLRRGFVNFKSANIVAVKNTLNIAAGLTRRNAVANVKKDFILRNSWTVRNIQFEKVNTNKIKKMESRVGATSRAGYMADQESGGQRKRSSTGNTSIGQKYARQGQSKNRPVSKSKYISRVGKKIVKGKMSKNYTSHKARFVAVMAKAYQKKLFIKRGQNIYRVANFTASGGRVRAQLQHIYNIVEKNIYLAPEPWLKPATVKPARDIFNIYKSQLRKLWKDGKII